jgi:hypothetical protein
LLGINTAQTTGEAAQTTANTANVGLAILNARVNESLIPGGAAFFDTFSRDGSDLGADWFMNYTPGSGTMGTAAANNGSTIWTAAGFADRAVFAVNTAHPMNTVRHRVSMVIDQFTFGFAGNQAHAYLLGRADATGDNFVGADFGGIDAAGNGTCQLGYVIAGAFTPFGSPTPITTGLGDLWDLECGTTADDFQFRLLQNNNLRADETDTAEDSLIDTIPGTLYKHAGFAADCYIGAGPFGTTYQGGPPNIQVLAAADF